MSESHKELRWIGSSLDDLRALPAEVKLVFGFALRQAQAGGRHPRAKPLKGQGGAGVLEIVESHDGDAYRAVYTVKFSSAVYVLHAFQKKSHKGAETPKPDLELIQQRLKAAEADHQASAAARAGPKPRRARS